MKNKLSDLNNHLFAQLERLGDEGMTADQLAIEIDRGKAITGVAQQIIANGKLALEAQSALGEGIVTSIPRMLG
ncbi:MAG: hypothetical protein ACXV8I_00005, partial [Methylobacter sp.]